MRSFSVKRKSIKVYLIRWQYRKNANIKKLGLDIVNSYKIFFSLGQVLQKRSQDGLPENRMNIENVEVTGIICCAWE